MWICGGFKSAKSLGLQFANPQITSTQIIKKDLVRKSQIRKLPHYRKICKFADLRYAALICGPPTWSAHGVCFSVACPRPMWWLWEWLGWRLSQLCQEGLARSNGVFELRLLAVTTTHGKMSWCASSEGSLSIFFFSTGREITNGITTRGVPGFGDEWWCPARTRIVRVQAVWFGTLNPQ